MTTHRDYFNRMAYAYLDCAEWADWPRDEEGNEEGDGWAEVCARGDDHWFPVEWADIHEIDDDGLCECGDLGCQWGRDDR